MIDQLIIGDRSSFDDFSASVASRKIGIPKKKSIKKTVPFSNVTYDFSAINGETYWEERELTYVFEIDADTPEKLEELKGKFSAWVMGVQAQPLHDPHIPDYHFTATYEDMDPEDDEGLDKTTLTVTFAAYPYKIANHPKVYGVALTASGEATLKVLNESDHPVSLSISNDTRVTLKIGDQVTVPVSAGSGTYDALKLPTGLTTLKLVNSEATAGNVVIAFNEEVF